MPVVSAVARGRRDASRDGEAAGGQRVRVQAVLPRDAEADLMPWLKSEGRAPRNDKLWELSDAAYRLYDASRHYAVENLTEGHVPLSRVSSLTPKPAGKLVVRELLKVRGEHALWHELPDICGQCQAMRKLKGAGPLPKTGYLVHDFLEYNPTKAAYVKAQRTRSAAGQMGAAARWGDGSPHGTSHSEPHGASHSSSHSESHGSEHGSPPSIPLDGTLAPYPVLRTPSVAIATSTPRARGDPGAEEPDIPAGTAAKAAEVRGTKAPHHVGPAAQQIVASARARR